MVSCLKENVTQMKLISAKISTLISEIESTPESLVQFEFNKQNDALHNLIIKLYAELNVYHRQISGLFSMPKKFPTKASKLTEIQEMRDDYIKIKMPLLYRKTREDSILTDDLYVALFDILRSEAKVPIMKKKEIVFNFYYNSGTPQNLIRDNDNYSIRGIINIIVNFLGDTDSGNTTWLSIKTFVADNIQNHTIIEVIKME